MSFGLSAVVACDVEGEVTDLEDDEFEESDDEVEADDTEDRVILADDDREGVPDECGPE